MKEQKFKIIKPLTEEKVNEEIMAIINNKHELASITPFPTSDFFLVVYREKEKTAPPEEDIRQYVNLGQNIPAPEERSLLEKAKEYKLVIIIAAALIGYYFYFMK